LGRELAVEQRLAGNDGAPHHPTLGLGHRPDGARRYRLDGPRQQLDVLRRDRFRHGHVDGRHDDHLHLLLLLPGDGRLLEHPIDERAGQEPDDRGNDEDEGEPSTHSGWSPLSIRSACWPSAEA
jgi:hypothetical protein